MAALKLDVLSSPLQFYAEPSPVLLFRQIPTITCCSWIRHYNGHRRRSISVALRNPGLSFDDASLYIVPHKAFFRSFDEAFFMQDTKLLQLRVDRYLKEIYFIKSSHINILISILNYLFRQVYIEENGIVKICKSVDYLVTYNILYNFINDKRISRRKYHRNFVHFQLRYSPTNVSPVKAWRVHFS